MGSTGGNRTVADTSGGVDGDHSRPTANNRPDRRRPRALAMTDPDGAHDAWLPAAEAAPSSDAEPDILAVGSPGGHHGSPLTMVLAVVASALLGALVVVAVLVGEAGATGSEWKRCPTSGADRDRLRALAEAEQRALVAADAKQLNLILADDYIHITPNGDSWSRDDLVRTIAAGELRFETLELSALQPGKSMDIQVDCQTAIVRYRSKIEASFGPSSYRHEAWHTNVYGKRDGHWRAISAQLTAVGGFPPPSQ